MNIKLSNNEHLVKSWDYAKGKDNKVKYEANLTVTSKRIVSLISTKRSTEYSEIPLDNVKSIECEQFRKSNFLPILGIIIGIPLLIVIVGIFLIVHCVKLLNQGDFLVCINTHGAEGTSLVIGAIKNKGQGFFSWLLSKFKKNKNKSKIKIDFNTANEICETIGAIILDHKQAA